MFGDEQRFEQWPLGNTQVASAKIDWLGHLSCHNSSALPVNVCRLRRDQLEAKVGSRQHSSVKVLLHNNVISALSLSFLW